MVLDIPVKTHSQLISTETVVIRKFKRLYTCSDQLDILAFWVYHQACLDPEMQKKKKEKK